MRNIFSHCLCESYKNRIIVSPLFEEITKWVNPHGTLYIYI